MTLTSAITVSPVFTGKMRIRRKTTVPWRARWVCKLHVTLDRSRCAIFREKIPAIPVINGSCVSLVSRKVRISTVSPVFTGKVRFRGHIPVIPVFPVDRACSLA